MSGKLAVSPAEAAQMLGIGRTKVYELMKRQDFPAFKLTGRTLVSVDGLRRWVEAQTERAVQQ